MPTCNCDAFDFAGAPHDSGHISDDGRTECETTLRPRGPLLSPHLFPNARFANDPYRSNVTADQ